MGNILLIVGLVYLALDVIGILLFLREKKRAIQLPPEIDIFEL